MTYLYDIRTIVHTYIMSFKILTANKNLLNANPSLGPVTGEGTNNKTDTILTNLFHLNLNSSIFSDLFTA